jgi:hypothetical protein
MDAAVDEGAQVSAKLAHARVALGRLARIAFSAMRRPTDASGATASTGSAGSHGETRRRSALLC